jgi:hypothetical protein
MPVSASNTSRLAEMALLLREKQNHVAELERLLIWFKDTERPVVDETGTLQEMRGLVQAAVGTLQDLANMDENDVGSALAGIEAVLSDPCWDYADEQVKDLQNDATAQAVELSNGQARIDNLRKKLAPVEMELERAKKDGVILAGRAREAGAVEAQIKRVEDHIRARKHVTLSAVLSETESTIASLLAQYLGVDGAGKDAEQLLSDFLETVRKEAAAASSWASKADLLLLKSAESDGCLQYSVLMKTPSRPGMHGVNIQGYSHLVTQDRKGMSCLVDELTSAINKRVIRGLAGRPDNASAMDDGDPEATISEMGKLLYRLLLPDQMQAYLPATPCSLTVTTNDLELPWELMHDNRGFVCLERPVARMPMGSAFPRAHEALKSRSQQVRALLIHSSDNKRPLPGAEREIGELEKFLKEYRDSNGNKLEVVTRLKPEEVTGRRLNRELMQGQYNLIHYAGHAHFNELDPERSGLLLADGEIFYAQKIRRLLEGQPLVFLNACQTGRTANEEEAGVEYALRGPAAGLSSAFVYGGALACVGSLWPIYDDPAVEFAKKFYYLVLRGEMIGEALRQARRTVRDRPERSLTWAAFVLYGDPTFCLV